MKPHSSRLLLGLICGSLFALLQGILVLVIRFVVNLAFEGRYDFAQQLEKSPAALKWILQQLGDRLPQVTAPESRTGLIIIISLIPATMFVRAVFGYLSVYLTRWAASRSVADLRTQLFINMQGLSTKFFNAAKTGDLMARVTNDTHLMYGIMGNAVVSLVRDPITIVAMLCVLLIPKEQRVLTVVSLVVLPVCLVPIAIYARRVRKSAKAMQTHNSELVSIMHETFTGNRIVKAYNLEQTMASQFRRTTDKFVGQIMRIVRANEVPGQVTELLAGFGIAFVLIYATVFASTKPDVGHFMAFLMAVVFLYGPIKNMARLHNQLHQAQAASERVFEILNARSEVVEVARPIPIKAHRADIHFENINFDYGEKPVLREFDLTIKAGQMVALVGESGSGKTTVTNLLLRFYDPSNGAVRIGGTDIRQVSLRELRSQISLVTQETILFHDTIRSNIALGRPGATDAEVEAAARAANAHEFIMQKPEGYLAVVGEKGVNISGGQRQRIAIARAILKDAPILVLDEATSALDSESERQIQKELEKLMQGRTTLSIAHRLSTIQKADMIVVMRSGRIVETGTHIDLLQQNGIYRNLHQLHFQTGS